MQYLARQKERLLLFDMNLAYMLGINIIGDSLKQEHVIRVYQTLLLHLQDCVVGEIGA